MQRALTRVVDRAVSVSVCCAKNGHELSAVLALAQANLQLIEADASVAVLVELLKNIF